MPTPLGSLNLTDLVTLGQALALMNSMITTLQDLSQHELPRLSNDLQSSVSGLAIQDHLNNMGNWTAHTTNMLGELQTLYGYLAPVYSAASGVAGTTLGKL
jgi:hypothetical protein